MKHISNEIDSAPVRYPADMAELLSLGKPADDTDDNADYDRYADALADHVPDLIRMVLDDDLNNRDGSDPAVWAPVHALRILAILAPVEAAEPILECLAWEGDWLRADLENLYSGIGPSTIPLLQAYMADATHKANARSHASDLLKAIAKAHPAQMELVVDGLIDYLDRPFADENAAEEVTTAFVISDLVNLKATRAYDAIRRAFAEDRVDTQILDLEFVEQEFGMRPKPDLSKPIRRMESGVRLVLKCKVCGRERAQTFPRVYYLQEIALDEKKRAQFDPLVIPQRVICPKCGAVDQYELGGLGHLALTAQLLAARAPELDGVLREDQRIQFIAFSTRWGKMHPVEAIARYQQELARKPNDADLHVGYGNLRRFLGYADEAIAEYEHALAIDAGTIEAWVGLGQMADERRDLDEAIRCWEQVYERTRRGGLLSPERAEFAAVAKQNLMLLRSGIFPESQPQAHQDPDDDMAPTERPAPVGQPKIGRNEPCPCGSGKKYKHCHGRSQAAPKK